MLQTIWGNLPTLEDAMNEPVEMNYENTIKMFGVLQQIAETPDGQKLQDEEFDRLVVRAYLECRDNSEIARKTHRDGYPNSHAMPKYFLDRIPINFKQRLLNGLMILLITPIALDYKNKSIEEIAADLNIR